MKNLLQRIGEVVLCGLAVIVALFFAGLLYAGQLGGL